MKIEDLPRPANYRRQMAKNGGYEMVPAYTAEEVLGILEKKSIDKKINSRHAIKLLEELLEATRVDGYEEGFEAAIKKGQV